MQKLEMLIKTVDAHYNSVHQIQCFYLSCSLVNIARGTCNLMIANEKSNFQNKITIKYERAVMSGSIRVKDNYFDTLQNQLLHQKKQIEEDQEVKNAINTKLRNLLVKYHNSKQMLKKVEYKTKNNIWEVFSHKYS